MRLNFAVRLSGSFPKHERVHFKPKGFCRHIDRRTYADTRVSAKPRNRPPKCCQRTCVRLSCAHMKFGSIVCLCVLSLVAGMLDGCATNGSAPAAAAPPTQKKGHWVTLPPETGSWITRRVWVDDGGQTNAPPSMNNVHTGSAADLQRMQGPGRTGLPPGS